MPLDEMLQSQETANKTLYFNTSNDVLNRKKPLRYSVILFVLTSILISISQIFGISPDYAEYGDFFDVARKEGLETFSISRFELGFDALSVILSSLFSSNLIVYTTFVACLMLMKGWVINAYALSVKFFMVAALFYFVRYFPLHDLTQLRAACAITLMLVGSTLIWRENFLFGSLICVSALAFHYSSAVVIPALFLQANKRWMVIAIACVVFAGTYIFSELLTGYLANFIGILDSYRNNGFGEVVPNPFAIQLLIDWVMIFASLCIWRHLTTVMKRVILLELIGMAIFYGGIEFAIIAHRIREFYSVFWLLFVIVGVQQKSTRLLTYSFIAISLLFYSYIFFLSGKFFH